MVTTEDSIIVDQYGPDNVLSKFSDPKVLESKFNESPSKNFTLSSHDKMISVTFRGEKIIDKTNLFDRLKTPLPMKFLFDLGGVFFDWDPKFFFTKIISDKEEMDFFLTKVCNDEWNLAQDSGRSIEDGENIVGSNKELVYPDFWKYKHSFGEGIYVREMRMKKGQIGFSAIHKRSYAFFLLSGILTSVDVTKRIE